MKRKILSAVLLILIICSIVLLTGCDSNVEVESNVEKSNSTEEKKEDKKESKEKTVDLDDNDNYFVKISGKEFKVGDKIANVEKVDLSLDEKTVDEKVKKNTYMIGGGSIYNSDKKRVISMTPYNDTDKEITIKESVIGGMEVGEYEYDKIPEEVLKLDIEVAGGIKFGSTLEELEKAFGKTDNTYYAESLGYTTYTYKSEKVYREYEFTVGKDGKVAKIRWKNLVYND